MTVTDLIKDLQDTPDMSAEVLLGSPADDVAASAVSAAGVFTGDGDGEDIFNATAHGFADEDEVVLLYKSAAGVLTGVSVGDHVFVVLDDVDGFFLSLTAGGAAIENTADGAIAVAPADAARTPVVSSSGALSSTPPSEGPRSPNATPDPGFVTIG